MTNKKSSSTAAHLPIDAFAINRSGTNSIQHQIYVGLRDLILRQVLTAGAKLPSSRDLATDLEISRNTVVRAYEQLNSEGYVETRHGSKTYVANLPSSPAPKGRDAVNEPAGSLSHFARSFATDRRPDFAPKNPGLRPSTPDVSVFPFKTWNRILGKHLLHGKVDLFNYNYVFGYPPLQEAIAKYLQAYRGVRCEPEQVLVTNGAQAGLDLLSRIFLNEGDVVWMEEPGYVNARMLFRAVGAKVHPLHVGPKGWNLDKAPDGDLRLIYATPSSQAPLGLTMRMEQRLRLLEIASRKSAWIIEDDFDSEYRLSGRSIPAMQGDDRIGQTIYVGTFAKTMFPAIRVGFVVLPQSIVTLVKRAALYCGHQVSLPHQATLCDFLVNGHFARHLRLTRRLYAERRVRFLTMSHALIGEWMEPFESDVGIQIAFRFKTLVGDADIAAKANLQNLNVIPLSRYYAEEPVQGLLLGYAALDDRSMEANLSLLAAVLREAL